MGGERLVNDIGFGLFRNRLDCFGAQPEPPADPQGCFSMQSTVVKRSVIVGSHKTSVSLEDAFWSSLRDIAAIAARLSRTSPGCSANVGFWHFGDVARARRDFRFRWNSGHAADLTGGPLLTRLGH